MVSGRRRREESSGGRGSVNSSGWDRPRIHTPQAGRGGGVLEDEEQRTPVAGEAGQGVHAGEVAAGLGAAVQVQQGEGGGGAQPDGADKRATIRRPGGVSVFTRIAGQPGEGVGRQIEQADAPGTRGVGAEGQAPPIGRPGGLPGVEAAAQPNRLTASQRDKPDITLQPASQRFDGQPAPIGRPLGGPAGVLGGEDFGQGATVGGEGVGFKAAIAVGEQGDVGTIRRPGEVGLEGKGNVGGQVSERAAGKIEDEQVEGFGAGGIHDPGKAVASGRVARGEAAAQAGLERARARRGDRRASSW